MVIAGEPSGDNLAAELVTEISQAYPGEFCPRFFGLGGARLREAGVDLLEDMTRNTVFGLVEALKKYRHFKAIFDRALQSAIERQPDLVILVDFGGFNLRFARALRRHLKSVKGNFQNWAPKIVYFVPPQVWASREGRAATLAETVDLIVSIFPFERDWYHERYPSLPVAYVGDPMATRFNSQLDSSEFRAKRAVGGTPRIAILPGSRKQEVDRHLPIILEALERIRNHKPIKATVVTPSTELCAPYEHLAGPDVSWQVGNLEAVLRESDLAIASSGTVTRECAYLRVPTVVIYKLSRLTYEIAKRIVKVKFIAMPNILADKMVFPELIQETATPTAIAQEAVQLLEQEGRKELMMDLERVVLSLGPPGATKRAAEAIVKLL